MKPRLLHLALASLLTLGAASAAAAAHPPTRPNLVVIMTDDQGYADVGFNGCKDIPTPHLDSIAKNGVQFSQAYVPYSVCSPSRAGFLTGRYPQRYGHERNPAWLPRDPTVGLPLSEKTLADVLGQVGYRSGLIGKWHLGAHPDFHPLRRGFNEFFGHVGGGHRYFPAEFTLREAVEARDEGESYRTLILRDHTPVRTTNYLTDDFSEEAVRFVERNKGGPFFLFLSYNAPHSPLQATEKYLSRFTSIQNPRRRTYAAMVSAVDDGVGQLLDKLRELKLETNTLVFYLSDNGGPPDANASDNRPLRGSKGSPWEGGIHVPFAAQWPGVLPAGKVYGQPVSALDIFATLAALTGAPLDAARPLDGVNLIPFVTGQQAGAPHDGIYLRMYDKGAYAVRGGDYKLVIPTRDAATQLFNLQRDLGETTDLAGSEPAKLEALDAKRRAWDKQLIPPIFRGLNQQPAAGKTNAPPAADRQ